MSRFSVPILSPVPAEPGSRRDLNGSLDLFREQQEPEVEIKDYLLALL